jgi:hypothetical protein
MQGARLELNSGAPRSRRTGLGPPIARSSHAFIDNSWQLFDCYLGYILRETNTPYWNPCSNHLHNALEASANSMDAWAIGLGVSVEGVAGMLSLSLPADQKTKLKALQKFIEKQVNESETHKEFGNRIQGLVAGLTSVRAIDKLVSLAQQFGADSTYVDAWKNLRNRGVHPTTGKNDITSLDYQQYIDELHKVGVLLYHVIFHLIGYRGPYTDYGARGFPVKEYPIEPPSSPIAPDTEASTNYSATGAGNNPAGISAHATHKQHRSRFYTAWTQSGRFMKPALHREAATFLCLSAGSKLVGLWRTLIPPFSSAL